MSGNFLQKFNTDGFAVLEDFLTEEETNLLMNEGRSLIKNMPEQSSRSVFSTTDAQQSRDLYFLNSSTNISYFYEVGALGPDGELLVDPDLSLNKIGHALHNLNPVFKKITFDERVKEVCYQLGYEDPAILQSMVIFKTPGIGGEVTPHQDATYLYNEPLKLVGLWIALEDATIENGCLWFAPGSHNSGVHRRYVRNPDTSSKDVLMYDKPAPHYQLSSFVPVPVKKGSCVLIHGLTVHFSEANKSSKSRWVYTFHVMDQKNTKYSEQNWLQLGNGEAFMSVYKN